MLLHYQICICISGHSKFDIDWKIFCKISFTLNCWLVCLLGCVMYNMTWDDLSFINTMQKTLKPSTKMFQFPRWMRKDFILVNFSWRILTETWDASCFKKGLLEKQQSVPNTCDISPLKKTFFSELNRCIFQIS